MNEISFDLNMTVKSVIFILPMGVLKFAIVRDSHFILIADFSAPECQRCYKYLSGTTFM
jgi:hypothetical protein